MKVNTSRRYFFPIYLICIIFVVIFPNIISLTFLFFVVLLIEIYRVSNYIEIRKNKDIYVFEGIINRKVTKLEKDLINLVRLEKNPYLYMLGLSSLVIGTFNREYKIVGIRRGEEVFKILSKN